jgi:hypothetical protein
MIPPLDFDTLPANLSDAAIEIIFCRTQWQAVRFALLPHVWCTALPGVGTWRHLPRHVRPAGTLAAMIFQLQSFYRERGDLQTVEALREYLSADRRDAILRACESPDASLLSERIFVRSTDHVLTPHPFERLQVATP